MLLGSTKEPGARRAVFRWQCQGPTEMCLGSAGACVIKEPRVYDGAELCPGSSMELGACSCTELHSGDSVELADYLL